MGCLAAVVAIGFFLFFLLVAMRIMLDPTIIAVKFPYATLDTTLLLHSLYLKIII